eukprot:COSAG06_NODE_249_length_19140_cov_18.998004_6_plen_45_part_00
MLRKGYTSTTVDNAHGADANVDLGGGGAASPDQQLPRGLMSGSE